MSRKMRRLVVECLENRSVPSANPFKVLPAALHAENHDVAAAQHGANSQAWWKGAEGVLEKSSQEDRSNSKSAEYAPGRLHSELPDPLPRPETLPPPPKPEGHSASETLVVHHDRTEYGLEAPPVEGRSASETLVGLYHAARALTEHQPEASEEIRWQAFASLMQPPTQSEPQVSQRLPVLLGLSDPQERGGQIGGPSPSEQPTLGQEPPHARLVLSAANIPGTSEEPSQQGQETGTAELLEAASPRFAGFEAFLARLDQLGPQLGLPAGSRASGWVVAMALAGMACELARRQLRTTQRRPPLSPDELSWTLTQ